MSHRGIKVVDTGSGVIGERGRDNKSRGWGNDELVLREDGRNNVNLVVESVELVLEALTVVGEVFEKRDSFVNSGSPLDLDLG